MSAEPESRVRPDTEARKKVAGAPPSPRGRQLPTTPRRYGQWAATSLFLVGCVLGAGWLWQHKGDQVEVLVIDSAVPVGHLVEREDLTSTAVSGVGGAIPATDVDTVVGSTAGVALVPGQVLTEGMLTTEQIPSSGQRIVGVELDATRTPAGLLPGDMVSVLAVPPSGDASDPAELEAPKVLAAAAQVYLGSTIEGGGTRISLVVEEEDANRVAAFGAAGRIALVQAPVGGDR